MGDSVARKLKEHNGTKIILISAYILDDALVKDLEENNYITKYIEKPILINSLIELVADTRVIFNRFHQIADIYCHYVDH